MSGCQHGAKTAAPGSGEQSRREEVDENCGGFFYDCRPTFSGKSVHRSQKALLREIQREGSALGTPNKVKARPQKYRNNIIKEIVRK